MEISGSEANLTSVEGLTKAVAAEQPGEYQRGHEIGTFDGTFCPRCGATRRMQLISLFWDDRWASAPNPQGQSMQLESSGRAPDPPRDLPAADDPTPALFVARCVQCDHILTLLVHPGPAGIEVVALPEAYGGVTTPSTPPEVAYYLDQAARSMAVAAFTAAVVMYRAALEHLLLEQGYDQKMLGPKIEALLNDQSAPSWRDQLDAEYLRVIKDLGNAAVHTNGGDVTKQHAFEAKLVREVEALFAELLDVIYEQQTKKEDRLAVLRKLSDSFKS